MRRSYGKLLFGALVASAPLLMASSAFASAICHTKEGDVVIEDPTTCAFQVSGGCTASCTPLSFTASCNAKCSGGCTASASASCTGTCSANCSGQCTANPGSFDCEGSCNTDCSASCSGSCSSNADASTCEGTCKANCQTNCHGQCTATPPMADCTAQCNASCSGSCSAQASLDCDVSCSGSCTASLNGGCTASCSQPNGALFCDGQFIDITAVTDCEFSLNVQASASASCAAAPITNSPLEVPAMLTILAGIGAVVARRRRRG